MDDRDWITGQPREKKWQDTMQVCLNGHVINHSYRKSPEYNKEFCQNCGKETITTCHSCNSEIPGKMHIPRVGYPGPKTPPEFCGKCGTRFPWSKQKDLEYGENMDITYSWSTIADEFGITKKEFGKKINFVKDTFQRKIIFRDIEHAYILAKNGFSKPSVILSGAVIEELLRQFLILKEIKPTNNTFDAYIKACQNNGLLKTAIHSLSNSVRHFRNIVHLEKEKSKKHSIPKATAIGAVTSIITIANDF